MVNFRGSNSSDPDGTALSYSWSLGDGADPNSEVDSEDTSTRYDSSGIKTVTLTVTDDDHTACCGEGPTCEDKEDTDTVEVTVVEVADLDLEDPNAATLIEEDDNTKVYVVGVADSGYLVVKATPEPNIKESELPDCWSLTGGNKQDELHSHVSLTQWGTTTVTCTAGTSSKSVTIYVVRVDINMGLSEQNEENPGKYINVNWDDDDGDGWDPNDKVITASYTGDKDDPNIDRIRGDNDFRWLEISISPSSIPQDQGSVTLSYSSNVKVWETRTKLDAEGLSSAADSSYEPNKLPLMLYVEGVSGSKEFRDVEVKAAYSVGGGSVHEDIVKVTVFEVVDPNGLFGFGPQLPASENDKRHSTFKASSDNNGKISWDDANADGDPNDPDENCEFFANCMECQGTVKPNAVTNEVQFDFVRERWAKGWKKKGTGDWIPEHTSPPWTSDELTNDDEDVTPSSNNHIYHIDGPGSPYKEITASYDSLVSIANFREIVKVSIGGGVPCQCSDYYKWHSQVWTKPKDGTNFMTRDILSKQKLGGGWIIIPGQPE